MAWPRVHHLPVTTMKSALKLYQPIIKNKKITNGFFSRCSLNNFRNTMAGVILAGGESSRMGKNKAFIEVHGVRMIDRTVSLFKEIFGEVILVTNSPIEYLDVDIKIVKDLIPNIGPLGGIYTGLFFSSSPKAFFVGCDMPFLNKKVIQYFLALAESAEIVVHRLNDYWEPLHAVYSRSFMKSIERLIELGERRIIKGFKWTKVHEVTREELTPLDPDLHSLLNFNTPEELKKLLDIYTPYG